MYDKETVAKVLELANAGCSDSVISRMTGVSRATVRNWTGGYVPHERKEVRERRKRRGNTSPESRERIADLYNNVGLSACAIADAFGCGVKTVYHYAALARGGEPRKIPLEGRMKEENRTEPAPEPADVAELQKRVKQLELENAVMRELLDILKADPRGSAGNPTNREKAEAVARLKDRFAVADLCAVLHLGRSDYYYLRSHPAADRDADIREAVVSAFEEAGRIRGYRYVAHAIRTGPDPVRASEKRVRRVMREEGCRVLYDKRKRHYSSYGGETAPAPPNLVKRDFRAGLPNFLWLTDITEFKLPDAPRVYLSPVIDCFDGKPVSWRMGTSPNSELADGSLLDALAQREGGERTVVHDDRGIHYRTYSWIRICEENGLVRSMSAKGCSPDNSACEGFFGRLKNEFFYYRDWRGVTAEEFMERLDAYLRYYCEERPKESLGWMSPNQFRRSLGFAA